MASEYFYTQNGVEYGPVSSADLRMLALQGTLQPTDMVIKSGKRRWVPAGSVVGLFSNRTVPPPLPQSPPPLPVLPPPLPQSPPLLPALPPPLSVVLVAEEIEEVMQPEVLDVEPVEPQYDPALEPQYEQPVAHSQSGPSQAPGCLAAIPFLGILYLICIPIGLFIFPPLALVILVGGVAYTWWTKCPSCGKWCARLDQGRVLLDQAGGYRNVLRTDVHYMGGERVGQTMRQEQVHVVKSMYENYYYCKYCSYAWTGISTETQEG